MKMENRVIAYYILSPHSIFILRIVSFMFSRQPKMMNVDRINTEYHSMSIHAKSIMYPEDDAVQQVDDPKYKNPFYNGPISQRSDASNNEILNGQKTVNEDDEKGVDRPVGAETKSTYSGEKLSSSDSSQSESDSNEV